MAYYLYNTPFFTSLWERDSFDLQFGKGHLLVQVDGNEELQKLVEFMFGQRFSEVISKIPHTWNMLHDELLLFNPVHNPEKFHIHGLRPLGINGS